MSDGVEVGFWRLVIFDCGRGTGFEFIVVVHGEMRIRVVYCVVVTGVMQRCVVHAHWPPRVGMRVGWTMIRRSREHAVQGRGQDLVVRGNAGCVALRCMFGLSIYARVDTTSLPGSGDRDGIIEYVWLH